MRWYRGIKLRVLKKYTRRIKLDAGRASKYQYLVHHDGVAYSIARWGKLLEYVNSLKPGDKVWNCFSQSDDIVKEVVFYWGRVHRRLHGTNRLFSRSVGEMIDDFHVLTENGYVLCDETMYSPHFWDPSPTDKEWATDRTEGSKCHSS